MLINGLTAHGLHVKLHAKNPYIIQDQNSESPYTRVWISDIPISVSGTDIESALLGIGCNLRSPLIQEKVRDRDGKPLERTLKADIFNARIYHKEQPQKKPTPARYFKDSNDLLAGLAKAKVPHLLSGVLNISRYLLTCLMQPDGWIL